MGYNSNRSDTKEERIAKYAKEISQSRNTNSSDWQIKHGAKIRGDLGVERGNQFIEAIKKATR